MTDAQKKEIDAMDYETLLMRWRFSSSLDTIFQGATGDYYASVMVGKKEKLTHDEQVAISKRVGWEN